MKIQGKRWLWLMVILVVPVWNKGMAIAEDPGYSGGGRAAIKALEASWSKKISKVTERFKVVLGGQAVLDNETGLVWERSPDKTTRIWADAIGYAYAKTVGGRKGWRLPTIEELASLVDPTRTNPSLPIGRPFTNVQSSSYWSSTTRADNTGYAWYVYFGNGGVFYSGKGNPGYVWCVRGGHGHDGQ